MGDRPGNLYDQTVLSGDFASTPGNRSDDSYTVVTTLGGGFKVTIDGFKITSGNANYPNPVSDMRTQGGGLFVDNTSLELENLTVTMNLAVRGGGLYYRGDGEFPGAIEIAKCAFTANQASERGGGVMLRNFAAYDGDNVEQSHIFNSTFTFNRAGNNTWQAAGFGGGGLFVQALDGILKVGNCQFNSNVAVGLGGGVMLFGGNQVHMSNCTVTANTSNATSDQGGSTAYSGGAGIYASIGNQNSYIHNSVLWGNTGAVSPSDLTGPGTAIEGASPSTRIKVQYSDLLYSILPGPPVHPGLGNINADPLFVSPAGQDFRLQATSPCLDIGSDTRVHFDWADLDDDGSTGSEKVPFDLLLQTREVDLPGAGTADIVDMGAHERQL